MNFYVLPINPEPWAIGPVSVGRRNGKLFGSVGRNVQLASYQEAVRDLLREQNPRLIQGGVRLEFWYWRRQDTYQGEKRKVQKHKPDVTNLNKATEDACQGVLFENDRDTTSIKGTMVQSGPHVVGAVIIGIEADNGLHLLEGLDEVALEQLRKINENTPPDSDNMDWGDGIDIF